MHTQNLGQLLPFLIPIAVVELALVIYSVVDLFGAERRVKGGNKWLWLAVIVLIGTIGPLVYLFVGREDM